MDLPVGSLVGAAKRIWEAFHDRPSTAPIFRIADYGTPPPGLITTLIGKVVEIEVHSVGRQPALIRSLSVELSDGKRVELTSINPRLDDGPLVRPSFVQARIDLDDLTSAMGDRHLRRLVVDMSPVRVQRHDFPDTWRKLPEKEPPVEPGRGGGAAFAFISRR
jgi:hypothetical protein